MTHAKQRNNYLSAARPAALPSRGRYSNRGPPRVAALPGEAELIARLFEVLLFLRRATRRLIEVPHGTYDVSLRIPELDQLTDGRNGHLGYGYLAALASDRRGYLVDVLHGDSALKADAAILVLGPLVHGPMDTGIVLVTGRDQEKPGRAPRREAPSKYLLVEFTRAIDVICMHIEVRNVPCNHHRTSAAQAVLSCQRGTPSAGDTVPEYIGNASRRRCLIDLEGEGFVDQLLQPLHIRSAAGSTRIVGPSIDIFLGPAVVD